MKGHATRFLVDLRLIVRDVAQGGEKPRDSVVCLLDEPSQTALDHANAL
jgi:hypothetical protein